MAKRGHGDGSIYWHEERQRWAAMASLGYDATGKRIRKIAYGRTKTEARTKLRGLIRDIEDGLAIAGDRYTVRDAVNEWLDHGLAKASDGTKVTNQYLAEGHILPFLGARKLRDLTAAELVPRQATLARLMTSARLTTLRSRGSVVWRFRQAM